jgi:hypothetical protein
LLGAKQDRFFKAVRAYNEKQGPPDLSLAQLFVIREELDGSLCPLGGNAGSPSPLHAVKVLGKGCAYLDAD